MTTASNNSTIWKFPFEISGLVSIDMPIGARVITAQMQAGTPTMWAEVNPKLPTRARLFRVIGTGHSLPPNVALTHVTTFQQPPFVWHLYEEVQ